MANLYQIYADLKKKTGGNRELMHFEHSFGMPKEEQQHITPVPAHIRRMLSQLEYGIRLSEELDHKYDALLAEVLADLTAVQAEEGTLPRSACMAAERKMMPMAADAKSYKLILAGHAHIDMNWMWGWTETVAATVATFTTMLNIMDEYPQFCFSQSQASVYQIIDDYAPELHDRIKARIDEGRWEVTASAWVETDKNMPGTESLLRHIGCTKAYLKEKWGIPGDKLEVDFSPDTFGHSANVPEIDAFGGVKYYYHCRALEGDYVLYRFRGQSGREVLAYREPKWYNGGIGPHIAMNVFDIAHRCGGLKTGLVVYGVGDHGGGPTRRDVERGLEMQQWPIFPEIRFGTFREYFLEAESVRDRVPVVDRELNFAFPGCYTTQSRIKRGNRRSEAALSEAETAMALAHWNTGAPLHEKALTEAWQKVLFTHFHDILTGSCVQDSREYAMGLFQQALATANTETTLATRKLSDRIDTSGISVVPDPDSQAEGAGVGYASGSFDGHAATGRSGGKVRIWNVFNNTYSDKAEPVEITVWDWTGDLRFVRVTGAAGKDLDFQLLDQEWQQYWDHKYFRMLVWTTLPALGYTTVVLRETEMERYPAYLLQDERSNHEDRNYVLENEKIRCEFDYSTGEMISMIDKTTGREHLAAGKRAGLVLADTNAHNSSAWHIGTYLEQTPVTGTTDLRTTCTGTLRNGFRVEANIRHSKVKMTYTLDKGASFVRAAIEADWSEVGSERVPVLLYRLPTSARTDRFTYNIPAGVAERPAAEQDHPGLSYIRTTEPGNAPAIVTDSKYGFRGIVRDGQAVLISTLINTATNPDPYPERGIHEITLALGLFPDQPAKMERAAESAVRSLTPVSTGSHPGDLAPEGRFLDIDAPESVVSAVYADENAMYIRAYAVSDAPTALTVHTGAVKDACLVNLAGEIVGSCRTDGGDVSAELPPHGIVTLKITK